MPDDDKHTVISGKTRVEIIPDSLLTMGIPCHGKETPCKIFFQYVGSQDEMVDPSHFELEVFLS